MKNVTAKAILRLQWKSRNERNGLTRKKFEPVLPNFQFGRPEYQHLQCGLPFDEARVPSYSTPADRTVIRPISPSETSEIPKKKMDFAGFWQIKSSFDNRVRKPFEKLFSPKCLRKGKKFVLLQHQNPPSLSTMLKCAGRFIFIPMANRVPFHKPYTNPHDLVILLQSRGLAIDDPTKAERYLEYIGYYRLSAYMYPLLQMPKEQHQYKQGATFNQVMTLYRFDKKLRLFIFNEIEKIEVAVRSAIVNTGSELTGNPFWMTDGANFTNRSKFAHTMTLIDAEINRSREDFIVHFKQSYSDAYPPAWILAEVLPFGVMTNIYNNIKIPRIKKSISQKFGLQVAPFESWLTIVTLTRNSCCHHARVWNKQNTIRPMLPNHLNGAWLTLPTDSLRIYFDLCIIKYFLDVISPQNDMRDKLLRLLSDYPSIDVNAMGFPKGWQQEPLWR